MIILKLEYLRIFLYVLEVAIFVKLPVFCSLSLMVVNPCEIHDGISDMVLYTYSFIQYT